MPVFQTIESYQILREVDKRNFQKIPGDSPGLAVDE